MIITAVGYITRCDSGENCRELKFDELKPTDKQQIVIFLYVSMRVLRAHIYVYDLIRIKSRAQIKQPITLVFYARSR